MDQKQIDACRALSKSIRRDVLKMTWERKAAFIGTSFSCADILGVLYGGFYHQDDDLVIMSKGHGASAWYAALAEAGAFDRERLFKEFNVSGFHMGVHPKRNSLPGIRTSTGSLGHGLGLAAGAALAKKANNRPGRAYVILGDGECNEGSVWEGFLFAHRYGLDNLTAVIDRNRLQSYAHDDQVLDMGDMNEKLLAMGWDSVSVDGHDHAALWEAFARAARGRPMAIVANTVKGKGVSLFEDKVLWHYKWPEDEHYEQALKELEQA